MMQRGNSIYVQTGERFWRGEITAVHVMVEKDICMQHWKKGVITTAGQFEGVLKINHVHKIFPI